MIKYVALKIMRKNNDSIIQYNDEHIMVTTNFRNKYIRSIRRRYIKDYEQNILVFSWTDNRHRLLDPKFIKNIQPLSKILNNKG